MIDLWAIHENKFLKCKNFTKIFLILEDKTGFIGAGLVLLSKWKVVFLVLEISKSVIGHKDFGYFE